MIDLFGNPPLEVLPYLGFALVVRESLGRLYVIDIDPESPNFGKVRQNFLLQGCVKNGSCGPFGIRIRPARRRAYVVSDLGFRIHAFDLPLPPVSILLFPQSVVASPGGSITYVVQASNNTDEAQPVTGWIGLWRQNGDPYGGNPIVGPKTATLAPNRQIQKTLSLPIHPLAPKSRFLVRGILGTFPDSITTASHFRLFVEPGE